MGSIIVTLRHEKGTSTLTVKMAFKSQATEKNETFKSRTKKEKLRQGTSATKQQTFGQQVLQVTCIAVTLPEQWHRDPYC